MNVEQLMIALVEGCTEDYPNVALDEIEVQVYDRDDGTFVYITEIDSASGLCSSNGGPLITIDIDI